MCFLRGKSGGQQIEVGSPCPLDTSVFLSNHDNPEWQVYKVEGRNQGVDTTTGLCENYIRRLVLG